MWTVEKVKAELPDVKIEFNGQVYEGVIAGRLRKFPKVYIDINGTHLSFEYTWPGLARCLNENRTLKT